MPRLRKITEPDPPNSMVASALRMGPGKAGRPGGSSRSVDWQNEAWRFLDTVGELRFATQWQANALSRVRLRVMYDHPVEGLVEVTESALSAPDNPLGGVAVQAQAALDALRNLFDGETGQTQMLAALGTHLSVPGESYLVGTYDPDDPGSADHWEVCSNDEIKEAQSGVWEIDRGDGVPRKVYTTMDAGQPVNGLVIRIWRPHPRYHVQADSPVRAALPVLRELEGLTKYVGSTLDSRLAGAGVLLVPSEMTFQSPDAGTDPNAAETQDFLKVLADVMATAMRDPGHPAARVPLMLKAPGQFLGAVQHLTFETELSAHAQPLREEAVRRLALSIDLPPEVLLGQSDSNHWSAWLISDDAVKVHVEPLAELIVHALTTRYLWFALEGQGVTPDVVSRFSIDPDTSALRQRSLDPGQSMEMHARGLLSDDALMRETRYDPGDAPGRAERARRMLERVALGGVPPEVTATALAVLLGEVPVSELQNELAGVNEDATQEATAETPPDPTQPLKQEDPRELPILDSTAAVVAACHVVCEQAVTTGWNRVGRRGTPRAPVPDDQVARALRGTVTGPAGIVASGAGIDPTTLADTLTVYAGHVLASGDQVDPTAIRDHLTSTGVLP